MVTRREFIGYCLIGILGLATHSLTKENNKVKIPILRKSVLNNERLKLTSIKNY